jgi:hypothetical protein
VARESYRFRAVHEESAQSIASQEAQNVRSLSSNLSGKLLDNRPGTTGQVFITCTYPFVSLYDINQYKTTLVNIENGIVGGKCVVS